jgi:hypothetical protein
MCIEELSLQSIRLKARRDVNWVLELQLQDELIMILLYDMPIKSQMTGGQRCRRYNN